MSTDEKSHQAYYDSVIEAYKRVFDRVGIGQDTYVTLASGGAFTEFSHEFQTVCAVGEDEIYLSEQKKIAINKEVYNDDSLANLGLNKDEVKLVSSVEVGNIFNFGTSKAEQMDIGFIDESGQKRFVYLGSYGIGVSRLMGIIAEKFADDKGLVWPEGIAPAKIYLISLGTSEVVVEHANKLYKDLTSQGVEVLYDERNVHAGEKFADADLMGIPYRVVVSEKSLGQNKIELKSRVSNEVQLLGLEELLKKF
jgi:prolyl-tRNA synthetase